MSKVGLENIGSGVFPVIGRHFNHSCVPNTVRKIYQIPSLVHQAPFPREIEIKSSQVRVNCGLTNYLVSSATIGKGEEVLILDQESGVRFPNSLEGWGT